MPAPPMKDKLIVHSNFDEFGKPLGKDGRGILKTRAIHTRGRVKLTEKIIVSSDGTERNATAEVVLPGTLRVVPGDLIEWKDRFGVMYKEKIETITEAKNYGGTKVYYSKAMTSGS